VITQWRSTVQAILTGLSDAETGQRGYLLTGRARYLVPYRRAQDHLPDLFSKLRDINTELGDHSLATAITDVQRKGSLKLDELAQSIRLADEHKYAAALALVKTDAGQELMEQLRVDIDRLSVALDAKEQALSEAIVQSVAHRERTAVLAGSTLGIALFLAAIQALLLFAEHRRFELALGESEQRHRALIDAQM
jgi:CHASE3 domain sensor protein